VPPEPPGSDVRPPVVSSRKGFDFPAFLSVRLPLVVSKGQFHLLRFLAHLIILLWLVIFSYSSFADKFLIIAADREFIPTTPEAVRIFSEVFASVDDSLPPLLTSKDRPWWYVEFPLSPMADPWIPTDEAKAIAAGIRPCVVQVDCVDCAMTGEGKTACSSVQPDPAVATWKCLLCPKKCEWASQLHDHVKEWHLFLHNYFIEGRMPSFENCIHCRELLGICLTSSDNFLTTIILIFD